MNKIFNFLFHKFKFFFWFPYEWRTPIGYLLVTFMEAIVLIIDIGQLIWEFKLCLFIGITKVAIAFANDIQAHLRDICVDAKLPLNRKAIFYKQKLYNIIQFHMESKQFSRVFHLLYCVHSVLSFNFEILSFRLIDDFSNFYSLYMKIYIIGHGVCISGTRFHLTTVGIVIERQ